MRQDWDMGAPRREAKEKDRQRRETIAKYFLDLSKLAFTGMVMGGFSPLLTGQKVNMATWVLIVAFGLTSTITLAWIGNNILK